MHWNLTSTIIGLVLFLVGYRVGRLRGRVAAQRTVSTWDPTITDEQIKAELRAGRKIEAIKLYRRRSGSGLKEAKQAVEALDAGMGKARVIR